MTREQKIAKRKTRAMERAKKHNEKYHAKIQAAAQSWNNATAKAYGVSLSQAKTGGGYWPDSRSPTGYSQVCSYQGICQFPCNGDC